jgi:xanthine dehydrogenase accessory factor
LSDLIVLKGAGDLGSGVAYRLFKAGYPLLMTELPHPLLVRRFVSFGNAVYEGTQTVEGIVGRCIETPQQATEVIAVGEIPVLIDADSGWQSLNPGVVIDARMAKRNIDTSIQNAPVVIGLGPGFRAGEDCHAVIETNRGHHLGRVIWNGQAEPNTGVPGTVKGKGASRVLRAPIDGYVHAHFEIGDTITEGEVIASVEHQPIIAPFNGVLRGIIHPSVRVWQGLKVGDLDPRGIREHCFEISDKALAIAGGVLEAILMKGIVPEANRYAPT